MNNQQEGIPEDVKQEMLKHSKYVKETVIETYNELSDNYEKVYLTAGWHDPLKCAELSKDVIGDES